MNNLSSCCGLTDSRMSASEKDLPVSFLKCKFQKRCISMFRFLILSGLNNDKFISDSLEQPLAAVKEASNEDLGIGIASRPTVTTPTGHGGILVTDVKPQNLLSTATAAATTLTTEMKIGKFQGSSNKSKMT